jgi:serine phosphatase RsbU (regulator of sigma subunit)
VGVAVGDVVGHDLRAAAAMGELRGVLRSYAWEGLGPEAVIDRCNDLVHGLGMAAMATAVFGRLERAADDEGWVLGYCNAGHPPPLLRRGDAVTELGVRGVLLGAVGGQAYPEETVTVAPGDTLLLYTDGVTDTPGADERFGHERLSAILDAAPGAPDAVLDRIEAALREFQAGTAVDDRAMVVLRYAGAADELPAAA